MVAGVGREQKLDLPAVPEAPRLARSFVRRAMGVDDADTVERITLCVSELVTNALDHAEPPFELRLFCWEDRVRIEVRDASEQRPVQKELSPSALRGRGMYLVSNESSTWGVDPQPRGKSVWAEFEREHPRR
jgi:anti-sigma regulatory factor (Ser/Thr protein kinase)